MHQLLFKNRFNALVFVAIILFSVRILVGTPDEGGALEKATAKFGEEEHKPEPAREVVHRASQPSVTEFTSDEDLIDDASGDDPSGWSTESGADEGPGPETADTVEFFDVGDEG